MGGFGDDGHNSVYLCLFGKDFEAGMGHHPIASVEIGILTETLYQGNDGTRPQVSGQPETASPSPPLTTI